MCAGTRPFEQLLGRVRESWLGALEHQDVPFERLVEVLAPDRSLARHPLFQVMLGLQNTATVAARAAGLPGSPRPRYPLARRRPGSTWISRCRKRLMRMAALAGLRGSVIAAADLFDEATVQRSRGRLVRVLAAVADGPQARLRAGRGAGAG